MSSDNASAERRYRPWTFLVYDDSAPENWRDILDALHVPWVESPLHEYDVNPDGEVKKAHRHIVFYFNGKKSYDQVKQISDSVNAPRPEPVSDIRGMCRYLIHRDNPEKFQYDFKDILCHQGMDVSDYFGATKQERYQAIAEMMEFIEEHNITEFTQFSAYCRRERFDDWFPLVCDSCAYVIDMQIRSQRHGARSPAPQKEEPAAGRLQPGAGSSPRSDGDRYE